VKKSYEIPMIGLTYTREWSDPCIDDHYPLMRIDGASMRQRFAIQIKDDGLDGLDVHDGDYLVFVQSGWPSMEEVVCFCRQGDEAIVKIMKGIYDTEPYLVTICERYGNMELQRFQ